MRNRTLTVTFFIFIILFSCKKEEKTIEHDYLETIIDKLDVNDSIKRVVLLPGLGCHGCIQEGEAFMKQNVTNRNILFILTQIESFKILQNKLEITLEEHPNVYIDKKNEINFPTDNKVYPCIVMLDNGNVKGHEFQSPKNTAALQRLKKCIEMEL
ncbi:hypothetical protein [Flavivirga rizhaonensis]|uniref:Uncharacterized protein n=1 Tax=Flavivirga rizhaonensis TaxID=2559571 RepID=A0A4S1E0M7_9FLAO|nr:hypothetical protein [Flavivirga rizhaonensis]TGV03442.1 hypothetical protein EM932_07150 [Flavivirga rizhaonensis]